MRSASSARRLVAVLAWLCAAAAPIVAHAQDRPARFLGREEIVLYGIGLKVEPAHQTVPKDIATIVSTYLQAPQLPAGVPPFAPDAVVMATLRGPSFAAAREITIRPNTPFDIPPLTVPGTHTLEDIRLVSGGEVLLRGAPESVTIEVIERLLVTQVTARPLTAAEIREKGIVFDQSNFQAYNFSAAFAVDERLVAINFPVLLPSLQGAQDVEVGSVPLPGVTAPPLPQLKTIIPDTLKLQTQIPNLSVVGFTLKAPSLTGNNLVVPPIPGVIVIPGDIGFLNQYFSVLLMVGNVAPAGSGLLVSDIRAEILLPPGRDTVVNSADDPLRMAQTALGESPRVQIVVQPGPDGRLGTGDDIAALGPGESGNAEYLVEGRREGSHVVEMEITGTLHGLPVGPVQVRGRAAGAVLVRNPTFTLTFTHPEAVAAGEPYTLDVTVTNTSASPANFVSLTLYPRNVSGATVEGEPTRGIESIAPGDSETVTFDLVSRRTGKVTAATLDSDEKVAGRFELKTAVGELGVPVSPDTLVLPKEAGSLPRDFREAALGLLGKAYAVATAPPAALPRDVRRFSRKVVIDRAVEVAEAGFRHTLREPLPDSAAQLLMDFAGSNYSRLAQLVRLEDLSFEQNNYLGFDELRRRSIRGDVFAAAVASQLAPQLLSQGPAAFHYGVAQKWTYRSGHVSVLVSSGGVLPISLSIVDSTGLTLGGNAEGSKIRKEIPFSDLLSFRDAAGVTVAELGLLAAPAAGSFTIRLSETSAAQDPYTVSIVVPTANGALRQVVFNVIPGRVPAPLGTTGDPFTFTFELVRAGVPVPAENVTAATTALVVDPPPSVISVIQQRDADQLRCDEQSPGYPVGRVVAVLFSEEVTPASVRDRMKPEEITGYDAEGNRVVGVALQPGRRIAFLALRDPIGPFIPRQITIGTAVDLRGQQMTPFTGPMEPTVGPEAGVVNGRIVQADGTPVPFANVRLFYLLDCGVEPRWVGIASKSADAEGRYSWDYVLRSLPDKIVAVDPETNDFRSVPFNIQRDGQRLNVDIVFLGRGTFSGTTRSESGTILRDTAIRVTSLTDHSQYGARTDAAGRFSIPRIPVGNIFVEAINTTAKAKFALSEAIPFAGAIVDRDITLLDIEQQKIIVKHGTVTGRVLRTDGITPAGGVPVYVWYKHLSQPGVLCPGVPPPGECAIAGGYTDPQGSFSFAGVAAGSLRVSAFDQEGLVQGEARLQLTADATVELNVLLVGGLGTVTGRVLSPDGSPVAGASVGGGLSLVTTNSSGEFVLSDVPVGRRNIVAVSEALRSSGSVTIDLTRAGDTVSATIVLDAVASVSGTVVQADGVTPVAGAGVYVFRVAPGGYEIVGTGTTNAQGGYRIDAIRTGEYKVSCFNAGFTDGNIVPAVLKYHGQVFRADIRWRGGDGRVTGTVFDDDGQTPLRATVSLSGDQVRVAGGRVGVAFEYVNHFRIAETDFTTGRFSLSGALVGPVTVSAAGQFSPDPVAVNAEIPSPGATVEVNLRLQPTSQIRGAVLLPNGVNPAGADVIVRYKSEAFKVICTANSFGEESCDSIPQGIQEEVVVTDTDGRFWLPVVNAGPFTISVEDPASGRTGQVKGAVRAGETAELTVRLLGLGEMSVQVLSSDTVTPIPGARVVVRQLNHPRKEVEGQADTGGSIAFVGADGFSEGEFVIEAVDTRNGFAGRGTGRITKDGEQVSVRVYLFDAAGVVSGRIYASNGLTPVPNAEIVLSNTRGPIAFTLSGVDGSYRIDYVPLGDFRVEAFEARTARRAAGRGRIDLPGQDVPLNLVQAALGVVKGRVMDSTSFAPLKGWTVTLGQRSASGLALGTLQTTSAIDGGYLFPGSSQGTFTLIAAREGVSGSASASGVIEREGETVDVPLLVKVLRPLAGTITGTVLTAAGVPAPNSAIEICHAQRSCSAPVQLTADPQGNFSLSDVPLGRFTVIARSQVTREAGTLMGELAFDGDIASVRVVLSGVSELRGIVERSNGSPAAGVRVTLIGLPEAGCSGSTCTVFTDAAGTFAFVDVTARAFEVTAIDPLNTQLKGAAGGALNPGEVKQIRIVLAPAFSLTGRAVFPGNVTARGIVAELITSAVPDVRFYAESGADGVFAFAAVPPGTYQLLLTDPLGPGVGSRAFSVVGDLDLGDVPLDTAAPVVSASDPPNAGIGVPRDKVVRITFSEAIRPATISASNVSLSGPTGPVTALLDVSGDDSVVTLTPLAPLADETRYTLRVRNVQDRFGKVMAADFVATFTTVDIKPPVVVDASPAAASGGVPIYTPIRIRFSETLNTALFSGAPIALTGPAGAVAGRIDYLLGNSVIVFTPNLPIAEDTAYAVTVQRAADLAGNLQAAGLSYQFTTTDRTPPQIASLTPANGGNVVENGTTSVVAGVGASHDVAVVDWYLNDAPVLADRAAPFELAFRADPALYGPAGNRIRVSAIATDTSGNRGDPRTVEVTITPDQPPIVSILAPADGLAARNGDRIVVRVRAIDDLGATHIGYRALTGNPADALTRPITPPAADRTEEFAFYIPASAAPGTTIAVHASAADTKAQVAEASIGITVLDSVSPAVTITGATSGARIFPGQATTVVVTAQDIGRIASVQFTAAGLLTHTETRAVDPPQPSIVTSFTVTVPSTARPGETLILGAAATDVAGNSGTAAQLVLPVADTIPPVITLAPQSGSFDAIPGRPAVVVATAEDEAGITRIDLTASGAVTFSDSQQVSPPSGSAVRSFAIPVPEAAEPGTQILVRATATDLSNNTSAPASLTLNVISAAVLTLPPSAIVDAGQTIELELQVAPPAPASGLRIDFTSDNPGVAAAPPVVTITEGQASATFLLTGVAGGTTQIRALVGGVPRAAMTATVRGGIVTGLVRDARLEPVPGAQLTVSGGGTLQNVIADAEGRYRVDGVAGPSVSVRALDPVTRLYGHATGSMAHRLGFATVNVVLIPAAAVHGTVFDAAGVATGVGVRVEIAPAQGGAPLGTTFTAEDGTYEFPLVTLGEYRLTATALDGRRGRTAVSLVESGQDVDAPIVFLGQGRLRGTVLIGATPVANAQLKLRTWGVFGSNPDVLAAAGPDGTFDFPVDVGKFSLDAKDPATGQGGSISDEIQFHAQELQRNVVLASYGTVRGVVYRAGGATPVAGAEVTLPGRRVVTDELGRYQFDVLPLGAFTVNVSDPGTRGKGQASGTLATHLQVLDVDVTLAPQGRALVTVVDGFGTPVPSASVKVTVTADPFVDAMTSATDAEGRALFDRLLAGALTVTATFGGLTGSAAAKVPPDGLVEVTVTLEPVASIAGIVYEPDAQTPAAAGTVRLRRLSDLSSATFPIQGDGTFRADGLRLGSYELLVRDAGNRDRARLTGAAAINLTVAGEVAERTLVMVGLGTVTGRVVYSTGASASNFSVRVTSLNPDFGGVKTDATDAGGYYTVQVVPVGAFAVFTENRTQQVIGEASGTIVSHGQTVTADVVLTNNAVTLPVNRYDGNTYLFDIRPDGTIHRGSLAYASTSASTNPGASRLELSSAGSSVVFTGATTGTVEDQQREVVTQQFNLLGLNVTRKTFVPFSGYFARQLELLTNPGAEPVKVDVLIQHALRSNSTTVPAAIEATSSGDAEFAADGSLSADRWVTVRSSNHTVPGTGIPSRAFVVNGPGSAAPIQQASFGGVNPTAMTYGWRDVTIGPGETVAFVHFLVQQLNNDAARAAAERLEGAPPEALAGLSLDEIAAVRNFVLPEDGRSVLDPLPPMAGTVTGVVREADGAARASSTVRFRSSSVLFAREFTATSSTSGGYTIATTTAGDSTKRLIPQVPFTVQATFPGTNVLSPLTPGTFAEGVATATADVTFSNTGVIVGTVRRADGSVVTSGSVQLGPSPTISSTLTTGAYRLSGMLAGDYTVTATITHAQGTDYTMTAPAVVVAGQTLEINFQAPAMWQVSGTLRRASGALVSGRTVYLERTGFSRNTTTNTGGQFTFSEVPPGAYQLRTIEPATGIPTTVPIEVVDASIVQDLTLIAVGSVTGIVFDPAGQPVSGMSVFLRHSLATSNASTTTDATGRYRFNNIPASTIRVWAQNTTPRWFAEAFGELTTEAQEVTLDIHLLDNWIDLPATLYDANNFPFDVQRGGGVASGLNGVFGGTNHGAMRLEIVSGGAAESFSGQASGLHEDDRREIAISQTLTALDVTRKVFVPANGYFVRYLEVLRNQGSSPVTVDVRVVSAVSRWETWCQWWSCTSWWAQPAIKRTSSGDVTLSAGDPATADRWVVFDDGRNVDPFIDGTGVTATAFVLDGAAAPHSAAAADFTVEPNVPAVLAYRWNAITIPAGGTVAFMHFTVQQTSESAAQSSAQRLVQLPPEAVQGLSDQERLAIRNFDLSGGPALDPLPSLTATVSGSVQSSDGSVAIPSAQVTYRSEHPLFGRTWSATSSADGTFTFAGSLADNGTSRAVPAWNYVLTAQHPQTLSMSPAVAGTFADGSSSSSRDVRFTGTATVVGTLRRADGAPVPGMAVYYSPQPEIQTATDSLGAFAFSGLPPGEYEFHASIVPAWPETGSWLRAAAVVNAAADVRTVAALQFPPSASMTGVVRTPSGTAVADVEVSITMPGQFTRTNYSTVTGYYSFTEVLAGTYMLVAIHPASGARTTETVTLPAGGTLAHDITLAPHGQVRVEVRLASGAPAAGSPVYLWTEARQDYVRSGTTDASGVRVLENVPVGAFKVRAHHPQYASRFSAETPGTITAEGEVAAAVVTLPGMGSVQGRLTFPNGSPAPSREVFLRDAVTNFYLTSAYSNANGDFTIGGVPLGQPFRLVVGHPSYWWVWRTTAEFTLTSDGEVHIENISIPAAAAVRVRTLRADGTPWPGLRIDSRDELRPYFENRGQTNASGELTISGMPEGTFTIRVIDPASGSVLSDTDGVVRPIDEGLTLDLAITIDPVAGTVEGLVAASDGTTPIAGSRVALLNAADRTELQFMTTAADGRYSFSGFLVGPAGFVIRAVSPTNASLAAERPGAVAVPGEAVTLDLTLPVTVGTVRGRVLTEGAAPVAGAAVTLVETATGLATRNLSADAAGEFTATYVTGAAGFQVWAAAGGLQTSAPVTFAESGVVVDLQLTLPVVRVSVIVRTFAADGVTGLPNSHAHLRNATGEAFAFATGNADGVISFADRFVPAAGFSVRASFSDWVGDSAGLLIPAPGETVHVDMTAPLSVIRGRITLADGSIDQNPDVFALGSDLETRWKSAVTSSAEYLVFGSPVGRVSVSTEDSSTGMTITADAVISDVAVPVVVDLQVPGTGSVTGLMLDRNGAPIAAQWLYIVAEHGAQAWSLTDAEGRFSVNGVPAGALTLGSTVWTPQGDVVLRGTGTLQAGGTVSVNITPVPIGTVTGRVLASDGTPLGGGWVSVRALGGSGLNGFFTTEVQASSAGEFIIAGVPAGPVTLTSYNADWTQLAFADGVVAPGAVWNVDLRLGTGVMPQYRLQGADAFQYDVSIAGTLYGGGTANTPDSLRPFSDAGWLSINYGYFCCSYEAGLQLDGRQLLLGAQEEDLAVAVSRKVYVPETGRFARYLEIIHNPTATPQRVAAYVGEYPQWSGGLRLVVPPSATASTYAVLDNGATGAPTAPTLAYVVAGSGDVPVPVHGFELPPSTGGNNFAYQWNTVLPPGGTAIFMRFVIQRQPGDAAGAESQAQALINLTDPDALAGMTAEEKAAVKNFVIPAAPGGGGNRPEQQP